MAFSVHQLPVLHYGQQALKLLPNVVAPYGQRILIVSDPVMEQLGIVKQCKALLAQANVVCYTGVTSEPTDLFVEEGLALCMQHSRDVIVSIGGGSCIDTAKAIAVVATNGGSIHQYVHRQKLATSAPLPHIAIPTTAGTGSEATDVTVITDTTHHIKMMIKQPAFLPNVAIVDPLLTLSSPPHITAATGIDALSHAIEAYLSKRAHPYSDTLALSAMQLITKHLVQAYTTDDLAAREAMALGATQGGAAFSNASVALVHGMSRPIGALFHVPHGISNAMLLPLVLEYSKDACLPRLATIGRFFEHDPSSSNDTLAQLAIDSIKMLCRQLHITNLREYGIPETDFLAALDKMAEDALASGSPQNNPKVPTFDELKLLYQQAFDYSFY